MLIQFPKRRAHVRASAGSSGADGKNSSGGTSPPVADLIRPANSQEGRLTPRRMRLIVTRSACTIAPNLSSSRPSRDIQSESCMTEISAPDARACQARRAPDAVDVAPISTQDVQMAPIAKPRPKHKTFLRAWRKYRDLTQEAAASRIGLDRTTLSRIERGLVPYDQALLERAADAYSCEPADLIMRDPKSPIWGLLDVVRKMPEGRQKQIAGIIKGFIEGSEEEAA